MAVTVLVVDDIVGTARSVAELLAVETGLEVHAESDPEEALRYAENHYLTVVVLDEEMPKMKGTELWSRMRRLNSSTAALMLTQERSGEAAQRALKLGYREHLWKSQIAELPSRVLELHIQVISEKAVADASDERRLVWRRRGLFRCSPEVWLLSRSVIEERYVAPDWRDYITVNSGQTVTSSRQIRNTESLMIESETTGTVSSELAAPSLLKGVAPKLQASLVARELGRVSREMESIEKLEVSYSLPAERPDAATPQIRARNFEYSYVFSRERILLAVRCPDCGAESKVVLVVRVPLDLVSTRQIDFYDNNTKQTIDTGFRRLPRSPAMR